MPTQEVRGVVRFLYTQNPFYLVSTGLILYGLQAASGAWAGTPESAKAWGLVMALFSYTALLALTGYLIVRLGGVWQDARSIVLVVLLLFVAISTSFDQICNSSPDTARGVLLVGLLLTGLISEFLLRGLRIRFPAAYRLPYYVVLSLFFLYPLWASTEVSGAAAEVVVWRVLLFPAVCGAVSLTLIPAIRQTSTYVKDNGTPWHWPWFPWTVFVFLGIGVCGRSVALTYSFVPMSDWDTPFGLFFLAPFGAAIVVLLLEIALAEHKQHIARGVLLAAPALLLLAQTPHGGPAYEQFAGQVTHWLGSPLWITALMLIAINAYAWWRGAAGGEIGLAVALVAAAGIGPDVRVLTDIHELQWLPLAVVGAWQLAAGIHQGGSLPTLAGAICLIVAGTLRGEGTVLTAAYPAVPLHLVLLALVASACCFDDGFARWLRPLAASGLAGAGACAVFGLGMSVPPWASSLYALTLAAVSALLWYRTREIAWLLATLANTLHATAAQLMAVWWAAHRHLGPDATVALAIGIACFVIATSISALKGGLHVAVARWWHTTWN
ncbi:MAG: hypothetical protein AB7O38_23780 [Pirellulaceae bacterium]